MQLSIYNKDILTADKVAELKREIAMRERVYADWASGPSPKLKPAVASERIAVLREILKDYEVIMAKQGTQSKLF